MRRQISLLVAATTSAIVISFVVPLCLLVRTLAEDRAMAAADQEARNVAILVSTFDNKLRLPGLVEVANQANPARTSLLLEHGEVLGSPAPGMASDPAVQRAREGVAQATRSAAGGRILLPVVVADGTEVVQSLVSPQEMHRGVARAWTIIIGLGVALMALALGIANLLGRRISRPVRDVAAVAHQLREGDLNARSAVGGPEETQEMARALNGLADRIGELLVAERAAVADLSHRLRTPVTALRLDAESVPDPALASRLQTHIEVLQRDIDAIVNEARRPERGALQAFCDATKVVAERANFWGALAEDQERPLSIDLPHMPLIVGLPESDLRDLVDVLIDNVFTHTADGVAFVVNLSHNGPDAVLTVADQGSGVPLDPPVSNRVGSTGLGLEIARRTTKAAGGSLMVHRDAGTTVEVRLPLISG